MSMTAAAVNVKDGVPIVTYPRTYELSETFAREADCADPLASFRARFHLPRRSDGQPAIYFCGHSLGLQPIAVRGLVEEELTDWADHGVEGHFKDRTPWYSYHELPREGLARLVGARHDEVVVMNSLTVNLHLMLATFYRPQAHGWQRVGVPPGVPPVDRERKWILTDAPAFPSDLYALQSQLRWYGLDPAENLRLLQPRPGEHTLRTEDIERELEQNGPRIAVVLWNGVNFFTGQAFDLERLTQLAQRQGCVVGLDLAHAAGNVPLRLHDWNVDFAVWCSYKYLNAGPGAVAGCFVHERHGNNAALPRLAGWWGNDPATRFQMPPTFVPRPGADGWQVSNPPILSLLPLRASLAMFDEAELPALRAKSMSLTGYLHFLLEQLPPENIEIISPPDPAARGCQLSLLVHNQPRALLQRLHAHGILCDFREPDVIRLAPVPLYNTFHEVWRFAQALSVS
jgi:kynureninase